MKKTVTVIFLLLATVHFAYAQITLKTEAEFANFESISTESVFVHFNSSVLLVGEYLYYQFYCLNTDLGHFSELSKIGYVELIGKEGEVIFKHKIVLKNGLGNGDFFIPTTVNSGSYKLLAYTNWMRNGKKELFFSSDITIINPYNGDDSEITSKKTIIVDSLEGFIVDQFKEDKRILVEDSQKEYPITFYISKERFAKREKVALKLLFDEIDDFDLGNYSLSVRKKNEILEPSKQNATNFIKNSSSRNTHYTSDGLSTIYLPELRGELVSGWVSSNNMKTSVKNVNVCISIPGDSYFFKVIKTDEVGRFHFNISDNYSSDMMIFQVLAPNAQDYKVQLKESLVDYSGLSFHEIELDTSMKQVILQRSIHNQIENAYYSFRPDSLKVDSPTQFLNKKEKKVYQLDDYTRFKTLLETVVEILPEVSVKKIDKDQSAILVQGYDNVSLSDLPPLILLDGCYIQNHTALLSFDARKIKELSVFRHQFVFGPQLFRGGLVISTFEGSNYEQFYDENIFSFSSVVKTQLDKRYYVQRYNPIEQEQKRSLLPDDRLQLLWLPKLNITSKETAIEFYTSDVLGTFEITLEGFTKKNKPISVRKTILVE